MSSKDIAGEASTATDALLALSEAGKVAVKKRKKEIKAARKRQAAIAYGARLANRAEQDKIDEAQEILFYIDPDVEETPRPVVASAPAPTPELAAPVVVTPEPEAEEPPTPEPAAPVVVTPEPEAVDEPPAERTKLQQVVQTAKDHAQLSNLQFGLAFVGLLIGLVLYSQWPGWATRNIENDLGWVTVGLLWFVGHVGLGAFAGGLLGTVLDKGKKDS